MRLASEGDDKNQGRRGPRRLRSLDEFETPEFVGRMARVRRLRGWLWRLMLTVGVAVGVLLGLLLF